MQRWQWMGVWVAVFCASVVAGFATKVEALVLRGQFPIHNGTYWNFRDNATLQTKTWVVLGRFTRSDVGPLVVLARQGEGFLALKEEWDGLYMCGEYRVDGFTIPDKPVMFMPFEIDFDKPLSNTTHMRVFAAGEDPRLVAEYDYSVTMELQALEDITIEGREIRNCAVLVKKTKAQGVETAETFWLVPTIGPVKIRVEGAGAAQMYIMQTYQNDRGEPTREFSLEKYFPMVPGTAYDYRDQNGGIVTATFGAREERLGWDTTVYTDPEGDVYYLSRDDRGLALPLKYRAAMGFGFASLPPDKPPVLLPARSAIGRLNHSLTYTRSAKWPSLEPMLDFYPEGEIVSVITGIEDVTVPAGTYRDCIKLCISSVSRSYDMQREKIRTGFIWLAKGVGQVKSEGVSLANTYLAETPDYIFQNERLELAAVRKVELQKSDKSEKKAAPQAAATRVSADALVWQGNSKAMFETAVDAVPFFVRAIARGSLLDAVIERADADGLVTEDEVIAAVQASTPEKTRAKLIARLEQMKTR